jgi:hypothetical protein
VEADLNGPPRCQRAGSGPFLVSWLNTAPLSKSAVSWIVSTLKADLEAWRTRSIAGLDVLRL